MPEKFNFATRIEAPEPARTRAALVAGVRHIFAPWLDAPTELMCLDIESGIPRSFPWSEAKDLADLRLDPNGLLFIRFEEVSGGSGTSVVSLWEGRGIANLTVALPDMSLPKRPDEIGKLMLALQHLGTMQGSTSFVVAGGEFELTDRPTLQAALADALRPSGLAERLCCRLDDLPHHHRGFAVVETRDGLALLRRQGPPSQ